MFGTWLPGDPAGDRRRQGVVMIPAVTRTTLQTGVAHYPSSRIGCLRGKFAAVPHARIDSARPHSLIADLLPPRRASRAVAPEPRPIRGRRGLLVRRALAAFLPDLRRASRPLGTQQHTRSCRASVCGPVAGRDSGGWALSRGLPDLCRGLRLPGYGAGRVWNSVTGRRPPGRGKRLRCAWRIGHVNAEGKGSSHGCMRSSAPEGLAVWLDAVGGPFPPRNPGGRIAQASSSATRERRSASSRRAAQYRSS